MANYTVFEHDGVFDFDNPKKYPNVVTYWDNGPTYNIIEWKILDTLLSHYFKDLAK